MSDDFHIPVECSWDFVPTSRPWTPWGTSFNASDPNAWPGPPGCRFGPLCLSEPTCVAEGGCWAFASAVLVPWCIARAWWQG